MPQMTASTASRCTARSASWAAVNAFPVWGPGCAVGGWPALGRANQPSRAQAASSVVAARVVGVRMVPSPVLEAKGWDVSGIVLHRERADGLARTAGGRSDEIGGPLSGRPYV